MERVYVSYEYGPYHDRTHFLSSLNIFDSQENEDIYKEYLNLKYSKDVIEEHINHVNYIPHEVLTKFNGIEDQDVIYFAASCYTQENNSVEIIDLDKDNNWTYDNYTIEGFYKFDSEEDAITYFKLLKQHKNVNDFGKMTVSMLDDNDISWYKEEINKIKQRNEHEKINRLKIQKEQLQRQIDQLEKQLK